MDKLCSACGELKPITNFKPKGNGKRRSICKKCVKNGIRIPVRMCPCGVQIAINNKSGLCDKCRVANGGCIDCNNVALPGGSRCRRCCDKRSAEKRRHRLRIRELVISHLGGKCEFCGASILMFLTVDHKNGDGNEHRRMVKNRYICLELYRRLLVGDDIRAEFRVLCWNCNSARFIYGDDAVMLSIGGNNSDGTH